MNQDNNVKPINFEVSAHMLTDGQRLTAYSIGIPSQHRHLFEQKEDKEVFVKSDLGEVLGLLQISEHGSWISVRDSDINVLLGEIDWRDTPPRVKVNIDFQGESIKVSIEKCN